MYEAVCGYFGAVNPFLGRSVRQSSVAVAAALALPPPKSRRCHDESQPVLTTRSYSVDYWPGGGGGGAACLPANPHGLWATIGYYAATWDDGAGMILT